MGFNHDFSLPSNARSVPLSRLRPWGVRWYVGGVGQTRSIVGFFEENNITPVYTDGSRIVYFDGKSSALVYFGDASDNRNLQYRIGINSINIRASPRVGGDLTFNWLYNDFFTGYLDGDRVQVRQDRYGRMLVNVPPGSHIVELRYSDPYFWGAVTLSMGFLLALVLYWLHTARGRKMG